MLGGSTVQFWQTFRLCFQRAWLLPFDTNFCQKKLKGIKPLWCCSPGSLLLSWKSNEISRFQGGWSLRHAYICHCSLVWLVASPTAHFQWSVGPVFAGFAVLPLQWSKPVGWVDPSESLGWCHCWMGGRKCAKGGTKWFCPTDAAVWLQQSSQGLDDTWGTTFLQKGPMDRYITILRVTMDSWLLWRAFTNEEEDSTCECPSGNDANEEWGRKL